MKRKKLNYRFHNPNSAEATADYLCKLLIEVNMNKVERAIQEAAMEVDKGKQEIIETKSDFLYSIDKEKECIWQ